MRRQRESEMHRPPEVSSLAYNYDALAMLRDAIVCHVHKMNVKHIAGLLEVRKNLLYRRSATKRQYALNVLRDKELGLLGGNYLAEKTIKYVAVVADIPEKIRLGKTLAGETSDNHIGAIGNTAHLDSPDVGANDVVAYVLPISLYCAFVNVIRPYDTVPGIDQAEVEAARAAK